jgi:DNA helicase-2/ATP-dependent DNA helicase PcrA
LPEALGADEDAMGGHHREERRLFYVAMTRAKDELVLTSAADYGSGRPRKVSRFVIEALDLPSPAPLARKSQALEALARQRPAPPAEPGPEPPLLEHETLTLSYRQVDDYETCPLKYRYVHVLRVPLLTHHGLVYGHAVHEAVRAMFEHRLAGRPFSEDDLVAAFQASWVSEGFLSRSHEEQRLRAGEKALRRFFAEEAKASWSPSAVEQDFAFYVDRNKVVGRYDLVLEKNGHVTVVDFKTGDVRTEEKAALRSRESLQLDVYALAWLRTKGRLPDRVELRFLESGLAAGRVPSREDVAAAEERIRAAASGIRRREFPARPTYAACGQCPFREICPHTRSASGSEA